MKKRLVIFLVPIMLFIACGDSFTSLSPLSQRNVGSFYNTETDFEVAINGAYDALQSNGTFNNNYILLLEMRGDNTENGGGATGLAAAFERLDKFNELNDNSESADAWSASYEGISRTNTILFQLEDADIAGAVADRIEGEALFIRSLLYYNLAVIFGNIPLQLEAVSSPDIEINQVDAATIHNQIAADLERAEGLLPESYTGDQIGKATKGAAATLLGKVYLTLDDNASAEAALRRVVEDYDYELVTDYADLWGPANENNVESIFEIQFKAGGLAEGSRFTDVYTPLGTAGGVGGGNAPQAITDEIIEDVYEPDQDDRYWATFDTTDEGDFWVKKFESTPFSDFDADNNWIELRYADALLMLAEALGESVEAYGYINQVRNRSGLGDIGAADPGSFEEKLLDERRREFAFENKRWPDLRRFGMAKQVMSAHLEIPESEVTLLYPIPQAEIDVAPDQMVQNPEHR